MSKIPAASACTVSQSVLALAAPRDAARDFSRCKNCGELKLAHKVCGSCGYYNGKVVIAKEADFVSIGTNDLTHFIMAANREEKEVRHLCATSQIAVLRAIKHISDTVSAAGKPVGICGESAADLKLLPKLIELGVRTFSISPASVLDVRRALSEI